MKYLILKMDFDRIVSRTVVVPGDWSLAFLHMVIQKTFGWLDYHQYDFSKSEKGCERKWTINSEELSDFGDYMESSQTSIIDVLGKRVTSLVIRMILVITMKLKSLLSVWLKNRTSRILQQQVLMSWKTLREWVV